MSQRLGLSAEERRLRYVEATRVRRGARSTGSGYQTLALDVAALAAVEPLDREMFACMVRARTKKNYTDGEIDNLAQRLEDDEIVRVRWTDAGRIQQIERR